MLTPPAGERASDEAVAQWVSLAAKMSGVPEQVQLEALGKAPPPPATGTIFDHADALVDLVRRLRALGATDVALGGVRVVFGAPGAADAVSTGVATQPDGPAPPPPLDAAGPAPRTPPTPPPPTDLDMTLMSS